MIKLNSKCLQAFDGNATLFDTHGNRHVLFFTETAGYQHIPSGIKGNTHIYLCHLHILAHKTQACCQHLQHTTYKRFSSVSFIILVTFSLSFSLFPFLLHNRTLNTQTFCLISSRYVVVYYSKKGGKSWRLKCHYRLMKTAGKFYITELKTMWCCDWPISRHIIVLYLLYSIIVLLHYTEQNAITVCAIHKVW